MALADDHAEPRSAGCIGECKCDEGTFRNAHTPLPQHALELAAPRQPIRAREAHIVMPVSRPSDVGGLWRAAPPALCGHCVSPYGRENRASDCVSARWVGMFSSCCAERGRKKERDSREG